MAKKFGAVLIISFMVAGLSFFRFWHAPVEFPLLIKLLINYGPVIVWIALFVWSLFVFRWKGLWLLLGAPFALFNPFGIMAMLQVCKYCFP
jgi:hypothetical protein